MIRLKRSEEEIACGMPEQIEFCLVGIVDGSEQEPEVVFAQYFGLDAEEAASFPVDQIAELLNEANVEFGSASRV